MGGIGLDRQHLGAAPLVPAPDPDRVLDEGCGRSQLRRIEARPEPGQRLAKGGDTAFRRHAGTGQDQHLGGLAQVVEQPLRQGGEPVSTIDGMGHEGVVS